MNSMNSNCKYCTYGPNLDGTCKEICHIYWKVKVPDSNTASEGKQAGDELRFLVYDLEEDPFKIFLDVTINEAEEFITRSELFETVVDFFASIRKEGYNIAILKEGDSL